MQRAVSAYLPSWAIDLVRWRDRKRAFQLGDPLDQPAVHLLIVEMQHNVQVVRHCCDRSTLSGVQRGMTLAHAQALLETGECRVEPFNPARDDAALRRLAELMIRFSPRVTPDPPDGLLLDIAGCERTFGGEAPLLRRLSHEIAGMGFSIRVAAAPTYGCAWAFARFGAHPISHTSPDEVRHSMGSLPIEGLRLDDQTIEALHEVNIDRIGHLYDLTRKELGARFEPDLLLRLDQALGEAIETINPVRPRKHLRIAREFDGPTTQMEAITITARELLDELCAALIRRERGVRRLTMELKRIDAQPVNTAMTLSQPSRNPKHLWSLLQPRIEKMNLGFGVEAVSVTAISTASIPHAQRTHLECDPTASSHQVGELLDTIMARIGDDRVRRIELIESYLPELSFRHRSVMTQQSPETASQSATLSASRPTRLLPQPLRIEVETAEDRPTAWIWRGERWRIIECIGPERVLLPWWMGRTNPMLGRDYYAAEDETGRWLWLYRFGLTGQWFLHGEWT